MSYPNIDDIAGDRGEGDEREEREVSALLGLLQRERGFDSSGYKRLPLLRRIRRRMLAVGVGSLSDYLAWVERSPDELVTLFDALHVNVTSFFREPEVWDALAPWLTKHVEPNDDAPIRIWCAGCSSGEEVYTLAMVLGETLGREVFSRGRVKIYATDVSEDALARGRRATYPRNALEGVPTPLVDKYFTAVDDTFVFDSELRRRIVFARHDLREDVSIPHVDLIACRNVLMYFTAEKQEQILERLQRALHPGGMLLLGRAESLLAHSRLFTPVDPKHRLFTPTTTGRRPSGWGLEAVDEELRSAREELETLNEELQATNEELQTLNEELRQRGAELNETSEVLHAVLESLRAGVVVLADDLRVLAWNAKMTDLFGMRAHEAYGKYFPSLEIGLPLTDLAEPLRSAAEARDEISRMVEHTNRHGKKATCEIRLAPLRGTNAKGVIVVVGEVS